LVIRAQLFGVKLVGGDEVAAHGVESAVVFIGVDGPNVYDSLVAVKQLDRLCINVV
jgi:hypothetical protein